MRLQVFSSLFIAIEWSLSNLQGPWLQLAIDNYFLMIKLDGCTQKVSKKYSKFLPNTSIQIQVPIASVLGLLLFGDLFMYHETPNLMTQSYGV